MVGRLSSVVCVTALNAWNVQSTEYPDERSWWMDGRFNVASGSGLIIADAKKD